jgi:hypothetical protein
MALEANRQNPTLSILTYSAFRFNTLREYVIDLLSFIHHPNKDLLKLDDDIIHTSDTLDYKKHRGKVKSCTGVTHNDEADEAVRSVVEGHIEPDITFAGSDPPEGGGALVLSEYTKLIGNSYVRPM